MAKVGGKGGGEGAHVEGVTVKTPSDLAGSLCSSVKLALTEEWLPNLAAAVRARAASRARAQRHAQSQRYRQLLESRRPRLWRSVLSGMLRQRGGRRGALTG